MTITNPSIEAFLDRHNVKYELTEYPISDINVVASRNNQVRHEAIDNEHLDQMILAFKNGAEFPPIIVRKSDGVIQDGNHRHAVALKTGRTHISAYVVDCTVSIGRVISMVVNQLNGKPNTPEEVRQHVLDAIGMGLKQQEVAERFNINQASVSRIVNHNKAVIRLNLPKLDAQLKDTTIRELNKINLDSVYREAARKAVVHKLTADEAHDLIKSISKGAPETVQMAELESFISDVRPPVGASKKLVSSSINSFASGLGKICKTDPVKIGLEANGNTDELLKRIDEGQAILDRVRKELT